MSTTSNRVASVSGSLVRTLGYDAAGNVLTYSDITHTYNNRGRLKSTKKGTATRSYVYNALGQRVKASGGTGVATLFAYDEAGHLLGEYSYTGGLIQETVWLGDIPVATLRTGTPIGIFYVHTDHLNTPRQVTRPSDNKKRWEWNPDPFGTTLANENPAGLGAFKYNLRFPGQYYEVHSGLHYNYFRDYDPSMGRYAESDPIGLEGGVNTYAYAGGNPTSNADPSGLVFIDFKQVKELIALAWLLHEHKRPPPPPPPPPVERQCVTDGPKPDPKPEPNPNQQMTPAPWWMPLLPLVFIPFPGNPIYGGL